VPPNCNTTLVAPQEDGQIGDETSVLEQSGGISWTPTFRVPLQPVLQILMGNLSIADLPYLSGHSCYEEASRLKVVKVAMLVEPVDHKIDSIRLQPPFTMKNFAVWVVLSHVLLCYGFNLVIA
jgi:hypothetical protein